MVRSGTGARRVAWALGALLLGAALVVLVRRWRAPALAPPKLEAEVSGCAAIAADGACELSDDARAVRLVVDPAPPSLTVTTDRGAPVATTSTAVGGAARFALEVPANAAALVVAARGAALTLRIARAESPAWAREARTARGKGDLDAALAAVQPHVDAVGREGAIALGIAGRVRLSQGDYRGAVDLLGRAVERGRAAGFRSDAVDDGLALAFVLTDRLRAFGTAREVLDHAEQDAAAYPDGRAALPYYRALVARWTHDDRAELAFITQAEERARRLGLGTELREAQAQRALYDWDHAAFGEACARYEALLSEDVAEYACAAPRRRTNLALLMLDAVEALGAAPPSCRESPEALLTRAVEEHAQCHEAAAAANTHFAMAKALVGKGDVARAREALDRSRAQTPTPLPELAMAWTLFEASLDVRAGALDRALVR
jgi:hypothetical protein